MIVDDPVDVVVVGAGPSGAVITHTLATAGFRVTCLEQGDWVNPTDFPANHPEWELLCQQRWHHDPNVRRLPADYPIDVSQSDMSPVMFSAVGGSSLFYGAEFPRLLPSDYRVRTLDGVADDWPITYADLKPYHDEIDAFLGVSGMDGDPAYPPGLEYPVPPHPLGRVGLRAAEGCNRLGYHWWPGTNAIAVHRHKTLEPCVRRGTCEWGCPDGAKASFDLIYMPQALKAGARLVTGARVARIVETRSGLAEGVEWIDRDGERHRLRAGVVVLCANGVGTPRLLLLSASARSPQGLANSSGLVGRNLMLHPNCTVTGYYGEDLESWRGPIGESIHSMQFYETDEDRGHVRGAKMNALATPGPLNAIEAHRPLPFDEVWGPAFHSVAARHASGVMWAANIEDLPEPHNRVELDPILTDGDGLAAPRVSYRLSENTWRNLRFAAARMREMHEAGGAESTISVELWIDQPGHLLGTARMGDDPKTSVVDAHGRSHDVPNLFVGDGSLFVTAGAVNPTATITALALRVGRHVAGAARDQRTAA